MIRRAARDSFISLRALPGPDSRIGVQCRGLPEAKQELCHESDCRRWPLDRRVSGTQRAKACRCSAAVAASHEKNGCRLHRNRESVEATDLRIEWPDVLFLDRHRPRHLRCPSWYLAAGPCQMARRDRQKSPAREIAYGSGGTETGTEKI